MADDGGCNIITCLERCPGGLSFGFGITLSTDYQAVNEFEGAHMYA